MTYRELEEIRRAVDHLRVAFTILDELACNSKYSYTTTDYNSDKTTTETYPTESETTCTG